MFLAGDRVDQRETKIRQFLRSEPSLALILAAVNFEWTVSRAVLFLSTTGNTLLRKKMKDYYSIEKYKELWAGEVVPRGHLPLASLVRNWSSVREGFGARNVIVHGKGRYTEKMATPHVNALLTGVRFLETYCQDRGRPLNERMPVRKK
jgi:hypothetical protein